MKCIRIILAEDHVLVREGTHQILDQQPDFMVVGEVGNGNDAISLIAGLLPEVAILDMRMPGLNAIEVTRRVRDLSLDTRILILSAYDDDNFVVAALEAGAQGYLLKTARSSELVEAVVAAWDTVLHPSISARMTQILMRRARGVSEVGSREVLTPREWEVLQLASRGLRNKDIADRLGVSSRTAAVMHAAARKWLPTSGSGSDEQGSGTGTGSHI